MPSQFPYPAEHTRPQIAAVHDAVALKPLGQLTPHVPQFEILGGPMHSHPLL